MKGDLWEKEGCRNFFQKLLLPKGWNIDIHQFKKRICSRWILSYVTYIYNTFADLQNWLCPTLTCIIHMQWIHNSVADKACSICHSNSSGSGTWLRNSCDFNTVSLILHGTEHRKQKYVFFRQSKVQIQNKMSWNNAALDITMLLFCCFVWKKHNHWSFKLCVHLGPHSRPWNSFQGQVGPHRLWLWMVHGPTQKLQENWFEPGFKTALGPRRPSGCSNGSSWRGTG